MSAHPKTRSHKTLAAAIPAWIAIILLASAPAFAQMSEDVWDVSPPKHAKKKAETPAKFPGKTATPARVGSWSIVLAAFHGPNHEQLARNALLKVQTRAGLTAAYLERRGEKTVLAYGRYPSPADPQAQRDLKQIKSFKIDGGSPFAGAVLAPPELGGNGEGTGSIPELDLRRVKAGHHPDDAVYTLEVAVYMRTDKKPVSAKELAEFRRAAEAAAVTLRREGEHAFYYHGPNSSSVVVGVFGVRDHDPTTGLESAALRLARQQHPDLLINGRGVRHRRPGVPDDSPNAWRMERTRLVAIPDR
jgi:hypothetical protein